VAMRRTTRGSVFPGPGPAARVSGITSCGKICVMGTPSAKLRSERRIRHNRIAGRSAWGKPPAPLFAANPVASRCLGGAPGQHLVGGLARELGQMVELGAEGADDGCRRRELAEQLLDL